MLIPITETTNKLKVIELPAYFEKDGTIYKCTDKIIIAVFKDGCYIANENDDITFMKNRIGELYMKGNKSTEADFLNLYRQGNARIEAQLSTVKDITAPQAGVKKIDNILRVADIHNTQISKATFDFLKDEGISYEDQVNHREHIFNVREVEEKIEQGDTLSRPTTEVRKEISQLVKTINESREDISYLRITVF